MECIISFSERIYMRGLQFVTILTVVLMVASGTVFTEDRKQLLDLRGQWKFDIGDDMQRAEPRFDDSEWEEVFVPSPWEDEGFPGYDGYGWYRKHFTASPDWKEKVLYLYLGKIDDVDEVYVNGNPVGASGGFPPNDFTAYDADRKYLLPVPYLNFTGDNVIAVRVYDSMREGGIVRGKVGVYEDAKALRLDQALPDTWKFAAGDDGDWKDVSFDDSRWKTVHVPAAWETQGFRDYDGFGWYRVKFQVPAALLNHKLIVMLGKIDDVDEAFVNGERIGRTGPINSSRRPLQLSGGEWVELRAYTIPADLLYPNQDNVLAVRVYDGLLQGGIYDGPVGIVTREHYLQWKSMQRNRDHWLRDMFDLIFQ
jgi:hypothetical protein